MSTLSEQIANKAKAEKAKAETAKKAKKTTTEST
tara:strand:- start:184 stop:285 length:102 start_codon:yes stop_codon:yes gene_type:complete